VAAAVESPRRPAPKPDSSSTKRSVCPIYPGASTYRDLNLPERAKAIHTEGVQVALTRKIGNWLPRLQANLAIDRLRLGELEVEVDLEEALATTLRRGQELHAPPCLEGLAELALIKGEPQRALDCADQLLALAEPRGMREAVAQAQRWRGEALLAAENVAAAEIALQRAAELAADINRARLLWDVHAALAGLYRATGQTGHAGSHQARVQALIDRIAANLTDPELRVGLPLG
jgi:tetratricopeptide (TPR) repeat protein